MVRVKKKLQLLGITASASALTFALGTNMAFASTTYHFKFTSVSTTQKTVAPGGTMDITVNVKESNVDTQGGESHDHGLPLKAPFTFTEGGQTVQETGAMKGVSSQASTMKSNTLGQTFTATYAVPVPTKLTGTTAISSSMKMWQPFGSGDNVTYGADADDPVGGQFSLTTNITTTSGGQLPEVPYAGILPAILIGGYFIYRYAKKKQTT